MTDEASAFHEATERFHRMFAWDRGQSSPRWWRQVIEIQLARIDDSQRGQAKVGTMLTGWYWDAIRADAHFLLIAIRHLLRYGDHFRRLFPNEVQLQRAQRRFVQEVPTAKTFRDFLEHLDAYAIGEGRLQNSGEIDQATTEVAVYAAPGALDAEVWLVVGTMNLPVKKAGRSALAFADVLHAVLDDAREAELAALFGRFGLNAAAE